MINTIMLDLTTVCSRSCPNCCCKIPYRKSEHYDWSYFERLAPFIQHVDRVDITGGEPTTHPRFREFSKAFRSLFNCKTLTLETNGFRIKEYADVLPCFDFIRYGQYADNASEIAWLKAHHRDTRCNNPGGCVDTADPTDENGHVYLTRRGSGRFCNLESREHVLFTGGLFYPCRLGPGVDGALGIELCADWREKVVQQPYPCGNCCFSPD